MPQKNKKKVKTWKLTLTYTCPATEKRVKVEVNHNNFSSSEAQCEMCGSHGEICMETPFICPECKGYHGKIEVSTW